MTIRALLVDDEPLARQRLRRLLAEHSDVAVIAEAANGNEARDLALAERPALVFLDVNMPGQDGLAALEQIHDRLPEDQRPLIVFTTAYEEHALRAFELEGTDYLVKPIERETLGRALRRVRRILGARQGSAARSAVQPAGHLAAQKAGKIINLSLPDVACVTLEDTIAYAHTPAGKFRLRLNLAELEERLPCPPFLRISRSALVNIEWVSHLDPLFSGSYQASLKAPVGLELQVSRRRAKQLKELLGW